MIRVNEIGSNQAHRPVSAQVQIETATGHEPGLVTVPEHFGPQSMLAAEHFEKRGKIARAKSYLRPSGDVEEFGLVNSGRHPDVTAAPLPTAVDGQSEPAVKVVGDAGANAPRIPFQAAGHRGHSSWKQAIHIAAWIESGVSAVKFPFGSRRILRCREPANAA
jgi:hypothetical protein